MHLIVALFVAAVLFSAVGLGGASGYVSAMALCGVDPETMRTSALLLNLLVSAVAAAQFLRAGSMDWRLVWPLSAAAAPAALIGGTISLSPALFRPLVSLTLAWSAWRLVRQAMPATPRARGAAAAVVIGMAIGFLSGLTGVGGGIFLTPFLLMWGWADERTAAGTTSAFIVVNSAAGLAGRLLHTPALPAELLGWAPAALAGGACGSWLGARLLDRRVLRYLLVAILLVSAARFSLAG